MAAISVAENGPEPNECRRCSAWFSLERGCINGAWYGYCSEDECSGLCEVKGMCGCSCHAGLD